MSTEERHDSREHEEELKRRNPDERSPEERERERPDITENEEGILGSVPGARGNKPTG
jgi:hypothetical protein